MIDLILTAIAAAIALTVVMHSSVQFRNWLDDRMTVSLLFCWFDLWIGVFVDTPKRAIYVFPVPMFGLKVQLVNHA